ncbi:hypothetical protein MHBO_000394 [Bonamia ostreae]|uniref:Uncharacterized protein n=1 Tax=Bonamia ostreae TaxID=126728 RepID=A0ABV2AGQ4_9EUKA
MSSTFPRASPSCVKLTGVAVPDQTGVGAAGVIVPPRSMFSVARSWAERIITSGSGVYFSARRCSFGLLVCCPASGMLSQSCRVNEASCFLSSLKRS